MKPVKNFVFAALLVSAFAVNAFAGDQETPGYAAPPPPAHSVLTTSATDESVAQDQSNSTYESDNLLFDALAAILSLF